MALLPWEFEKRASIRASISAAEKFGNDGTPDAREDQLNDRITPLVLSEEEMSRAEPPEDDMDARDAAAHRKKTAVWSLKQRKAKASFRESSPARDQQFDRRAPFDPVEQERRMLRDQEAPGVVWTIGEDSLGQCGHAAARPDDTPYPAPIEPKRLKGGVRSIHAGPVCTISVGVRARSASGGRLMLRAITLALALTPTRSARSCSTRSVRRSASAQARSARRWLRRSGRRRTGASRTRARRRTAC